MIHEIILSLIGQTGDIIILVEKKKRTLSENNVNIDEYGFEVNNNIHIFLNSEIKIINEIVELGYYFYIINLFCLLVKKNTIYKNLTHIHKFNKLNEEKKKINISNENSERDNNTSTTVSSTSFSSSSYESSTNEKREGKYNLNTSNKKSNVKDRNEVDNYFGVILKNIKSLNNVNPYGYYANGLCNEINKFINKYLKKISEIEEYINNNNNTPLTQILTMLEKKREEIIIIINIIKNYLEFQKREERNVLEGESRNKTKEIIDYLYENCLSGNSRIKSIYYKYLKNLGKILLQQIFSWILYGQLIDPYYEFFIQKRQFIYSDDKKIFLSPEELYENLTLTNVQSLNFEWNYLFFQSISNLPECCIDKIVGRKILFIGKSVRILIRSNKWNTNDIIKLFSITKILSKAFNEKPNRSYKKNIANENYNMHLENHTNDKSDYTSVISDSSRSSSNTSYEKSSESDKGSLNLYCKEIFDITIEKIRSIIAYKLWKYIVKDINLIKIFDLFKDIYLLNNGDFYDYFLEKSWSLMHTPPNSKNEILLKILAWKNSSILVENYCKTKYENKKDKLKLDNYENTLFAEYSNNENESNFFTSANTYMFDTGNAENIISKYFYPRISHKKFSYDSFEKEKYDNLILGGMSYIYDKKIVLNDFFKGIQTLSKKKYYDYDNIFSVCINNYRQQILRGFKHGFDFSVNFNNFFDNKSIYTEKKETDTNKNSINNNTNNLLMENDFLVGSCFALVIHSVKNPLLYKTDLLDSSLGYWGSLGDCLSVEIKVKFYEKKDEKKNLKENKINSNNEYSNNLNEVILGDVEVEVSLYIGGKGISSFVHNNNSYSVDYTKESILNNKLLEGSINKEKKKRYDDIENEENYLKKNKNNIDETNEDDMLNEYMYHDNKKQTKLPVLKIQSNKQTFSDINKNTLTKFRVRINCLKHSFSVYIQKLDEYNINFINQKNKIKPIIHIRALDMTQAFTLDIGNAYIGFYTCPILFKHKLLKKKSKLNEWFKNFYAETLNVESTVYKKNFFNIENEENKEIIQKEINNINKIILYNNNANELDKINYKKKKKKHKSKKLLFSSYDCSVEIYKWFHQSYKSPIEIPEIDIDNETLIFYDKQIDKNIKIHSGLNLWNNIEIYFKLTWPIALIINTNTIYTYNSIFQFLFLLGRIYYNLKILCYHNRHLYKYLNYKRGTLLFSYLFSIRYKMQFFFFHLIKYLQEDIINYEYKLMTTQIHKSKDFEYTKSIHDLYISQIATKCFLRVQNITTPLIELIDITFKFCYFFQCLIENELFTDILNYDMINEKEENKSLEETDNKNNENYDDKNEDLNQVIEKLLQYNDTFNEKLICVVNEMINISSNSNHAYLVHFITTLDFNNYVTKIKESRTKMKNENIEKTKQIQDDTMDINKNIHLNKNNDNKMEYEDIENINMSDNCYLDKKELYSNNLLNDTNTSINDISQNIQKINEIDNNNNFIKKRIVNNFNNLLYNNIDNNKNLQKNNINEYSLSNMPTQANKNFLNNNINITNIDYNNNNTLNNNYLINKYSNILNSYMNNSNNSNSIYNLPKNYANNSNLNSYNSILDTAYLRDTNHMNNTSNVLHNNISNYNICDFDLKLNMNNKLNYESNISKNINSTNQNIDIGNNNNLYDQNSINIRNNINSGVTNNLNNLIDLNVKNKFNVQNLIDNYNYNYDNSSNNYSFNNCSLNKYDNTSQLYNTTNLSNYSNIPLNIYQNENNINEMNKKNKKH
ncbi:conserved Plasmodium protein, unknown function [Plasmodium gallinaceum]|uniref:Gamma-tubulin complex component n=1 Tax=Plasmodium gallinaceum TaxID=5849 RepID=A0A1J1GQ32_PLAGA|nr:conserved Plasmodium protein, unknown function [Plasmodium gallinaceum]CRG94631.1 conserved Plasmodium protein, unknown function [Plasmodium gallinaceum]